jgi:hypothetical protein
MEGINMGLSSQIGSVGARRLRFATQFKVAWRRGLEKRVPDGTPVSAQIDGIQNDKRAADTEYKAQEPANGDVAEHLHGDLLSRSGTECARLQNQRFPFIPPNYDSNFSLKGDLQRKIRICINDGNLPGRFNSMTDYRVKAGEAQEDQVTAMMEKYTSQLPSSAFLGLAIASIAASVTIQIVQKEKANNALFVGQWVAPFLLLGIYNKMVKQHGSDAETR